MYPKYTRLLTVRASIGDTSDVEVLIDGGSQLNLISALLVKELDLTVKPLPQMLAEGVNGSELPIYGTTDTDVTITDSRGHKETHKVCFVVTDLKRYKMYLGLPWIDQYDPRLSYRSRRMLFKGRKHKDFPKREKVSIEDAEEFDHTMRSPSSDVYVCSVNSVGQVVPKMVQNGQIPEVYREYAHLGSEDGARALPDHGEQDLAIDITPGATPPYQPLYGLSATELEILRKYLADYLQRGWIRRSRSPAGAPILFAKKKDGSLRLCVDYRGLNKITVKNRHPLPLITESLERLAEARFYTKLDVREAYHRIRIKEGDEWKTAFRTRYGHFEYTVMPFGLTNAPAQFQAYINKALIGLIDVTCIVYLDDILVFSKTEEEHVDHVKEVLGRLKESRLYVRLDKCEWHTSRTEYLGYIVSPEGLTIDPERVKTIQEWPTPATVRDIRVFIGFMSYYRRFVAGFSKLALPLTKLTQKEPNSARGGQAMRREESQPLKLNDEARNAFQKLKDSFLEIPILAHFESVRQTRTEVDASGGAISGILSQLVEREGRSPQWRPIDFYSRKLIQAEYNYDTHDQELLAIVRSLQHWRRYLDGIFFEVLTDHQNLKWFMDTKVLSHRQVRAYLVLSQFNFVITHRPGATNPADGPSRRPDYMKEAQKLPQKHNEAFVEPLQKMLQRTASNAKLVAAMTLRSRNGGREALKTANQPIARDYTSNDTLESEDDPVEHWSSSEESENDEEGQNEPEPATVKRKRLITLTQPEDKVQVIRECHNDPMAGHFGTRKTLEKVQRRYTWKNVAKEVADYCHDCLICRRSSAARHKPYGLLQPIPPPSKAWEEVTMDFITELPPSRLGGHVYDSILVVVCRLTKMAHYIPARADWDGQDLAQAWIREIIRLHGSPARIISDRGPLMKANAWDTFTYYLNSRRVLTSAYHPQTDGQTERQNQTLEQYLRCYCTLEQDDWALWISIAEFAYNDSMHATTKTTPFQACQGMNPRGTDWPIVARDGKEAPLAKELATRVVSLQKTCKENIERANEYQRNHANKKRLEANFKVGDRVLVSSKNIRTVRPKKKLDWKYLGPGSILARIGPSAYRVDLPGAKGVHPVFHASLLEPYRERSTLPTTQDPIQEPLVQGSEDSYDVEEVRDRRQRKDGQWEYLIKWEGYPDSENTWEIATNLSQETLKQYWKNTKRPLRKRTRTLRSRPRKEGIQLG
jgi:hypothetical protein